MLAFCGFHFQPPLPLHPQLHHAWLSNTLLSPPPPPFLHFPRQPILHSTNIFTRPFLTTFKFCPHVGGIDLAHPNQKQPPTAISSAPSLCLNSPGDQPPPVENGVLLPPLANDPQVERFWITQTLTSWLDKEWIVQEANQLLAKRTADIYIALRDDSSYHIPNNPSPIKPPHVHNKNDLGDLVIAIATELDKDHNKDSFTDAYVGAFDVANKLSELLLVRMGRPVCCTNGDDTQEIRAFMSQHSNNLTTTGSDKNDTSSPQSNSKAHPSDSVASNFEPSASSTSPSSPTSFPTPASGTTVTSGGMNAFTGDGRGTLDKNLLHIAPVDLPKDLDEFERYNYLAEILDGDAKQSHIEAFIALSIGYAINPRDGSWIPDGIKSDWFKMHYPRVPPRFLADQKAFERLVFTLNSNEDYVRDGLDAVIETLHGEELTKIRRKENDKDFYRREIAVRWLHLYGNF